MTLNVDSSLSLDTKANQAKDQKKDSIGISTACFTESVCGGVALTKCRATRHHGLGRLDSRQGRTTTARVTVIDVGVVGVATTAQEGLLRLAVVVSVEIRAQIGGHC